MNHKPEIHRQITISHAESSALVCALDFLSHCEGFSWSNKPFDWKIVAAVTEKLENDVAAYSKNELAACLAALDLALQSVLTHDENFDQVADVFPELIPDLKDSTNILQKLKQRLLDYVADLS